ncbi:MAG: DUF3394 domain-containing protein, partial [Rhodospirillaceae bacterium]|nr:DUF3394 domain-containing protein [Rhodospirillaceae bacterium]
VYGLVDDVSLDYANLYDIRDVLANHPEQLYIDEFHITPAGNRIVAGRMLEILVEDGKVLIDGTTFDSPAAKAGLDFDQVIQTVLVPVDQPSKLLMYIPALVLLGFIVLLQRRRNGVAAEAAAPA